MDYEEETNGSYHHVHRHGGHLDGKVIDWSITSREEEIITCPSSSQGANISDSELRCFIIFFPQLGKAFWLITRLPIQPLSIPIQCFIQSRAVKATMQ